MLLGSITIPRMRWTEDGGASVRVIANHYPATVAKARRHSRLTIHTIIIHERRSDETIFIRNAIVVRLKAQSTGVWDMMELVRFAMYALSLH